jgi:hypothetical protein
MGRKTNSTSLLPDFNEAGSGLANVFGYNSFAGGESSDLTQKLLQSPEYGKMSLVDQSSALARTSYADNLINTRNYKDSLMGGVDTALGNLGKGASAFSSLAGIYLRFKNLDMAKEQLCILKEKWGLAKNEYFDLKDTSNKITATYNGQAAPPPVSRTVRT